MNNNALGLRTACIKTLATVEADINRSNQHEFNGVVVLKQMFGESGFEKNAKFSIRGTGIECTATVTWYDARENHPTRSEHRLYFQTNQVMQQATAGDNVVIGFDRAGDLNVILIPGNTVDYQNTQNSWQPMAE